MITVLIIKIPVEHQPDTETAAVRQRIQLAALYASSLFNAIKLNDDKDDTEHFCVIGKALLSAAFLEADKLKGEIL